MTKNNSVLKWLEEMKDLVVPDQVVWIDGSEEQLRRLREESCATGEMIALNQEKLPGCYLHRTKENDVARVEARTFICSRREEDAGPTNNWREPQETYRMLYDIARGSYRGRTMYVIPYSMGPVGSPFSKIGYELTDSIYVVLNMAIMTRVGTAVEEALGDSEDWVRGCIAAARWMRRNGIFATSRKIIPLFPSIPLTAATSCWAKNALPCVLHRILGATRAGWPNICSFWVSKTRRAR